MVDQCGCHLGERCVLDYSGTGRPSEMCVAGGIDPPGTPCDDGFDNCTAGSQCEDEEGDGYTCIPYCRSERDCPGGWHCFGGVPGLTPDDEYRRCSDPPESCDPFTAEGCAAGEGCVASSGTTECREAGTSRPGEPCALSCVVGSACFLFDVESGALCVKYCRLDGGLPDCSDVPGTVCAAGLGLPEVGVCRAP